MRFLPIVASLVFNEMGTGMTSLLTLPAFIGLVPSMDLQMNLWLRGLSEGLTMFIIHIEAFSGMDPLMANQMWALIGKLPY